MIKYIGCFFLLFSFTVIGQTKKEIQKGLEGIESIEKAEKYILANPTWSIELVTLSDADANIPKELIQLKRGQSKRINLNGEKHHYKLLEKIQEIKYRASYIYLNGKELSTKQIDSLRPLIIQKYNSGIPFETLVELYTMDGNPNQGDLGWFKPSVMVPEFEEAVKNHKKGAVFIVDVTSKKWYYVVLKTYDNTIKIDRIFIKIIEQ